LIDAGDRCDISDLRQCEGQASGAAPDIQHSIVSHHAAESDE
jgi:hypothetical protein